MTTTLISDKWAHRLHQTGVFLFLLGTLDPMEGSILILIGSAIITQIVFLKNRKYCRTHLLSTLLIAFGVFFLFYLSSLGGFGGNSTLSWWYGCLILPYPMGWIITLVLLLMRLKKKTIPVS